MPAVINERLLPWARWGKINLYSNETYKVLLNKGNINILKEVICARVLLALRAMYSSPTVEYEWVQCYLWCSMFLMQRYAATRLSFAMMQDRQRLCSLSLFFSLPPYQHIMFHKVMNFVIEDIKCHTETKQIHPRTFCPAVMPVWKTKINLSASYLD